MNKELQQYKRKEIHQKIELNNCWIRFIQYCKKTDFGEITKVQIQNSVPVSAESVIKKIKFT